MGLLRLLLAFALILAIPLQGFAASTCPCKLREVQKQVRVASRAAVAARLASPRQAPEAHAARSSAEQGSAPTKHPIQHAHCAQFSMSCCCHATASASALAATESPDATVRVVPYVAPPLARWEEPVPDKPPRT